MMFGGLIDYFDSPHSGREETGMTIEFLAPWSVIAVRDNAICRAAYLYRPCIAGGEYREFCGLLQIDLAASKKMYAAKIDEFLSYLRNIYPDGMTYKEKAALAKICLELMLLSHVEKPIQWVEA